MPRVILFGLGINLKITDHGIPEKRVEKCNIEVLLSKFSSFAYLSLFRV
jgi:hypothetical protein